jgi:hypothetical protein
MECIRPRNFENIPRKLENISAGKREQEFAIKMEILPARDRKIPHQERWKTLPARKFRWKTFIYDPKIILALYDVP